MKKFLSRYSIKYPQSLAYMLQASEYNVHDFWVWYKRVKDFRNVEQRKKLIRTPKATLILFGGYIMYVLSLILTIDFSFITNSVSIFVIGIILLPYIVLWLFILETSLINKLQKPIERRIVEKARKKLSTHKGIKIAIAGSFGKTTMKEILKTVLGQSKKVSATPDNKNTPLGIARFVEKLKGDEEILIFEMGEYYPGDIKTLCEVVNPDIGVITGVNEAHLDKFKNLEKTTETIFELADFLKNKDGGRLYVNSQNRLAKEKAAHLDVVFYGNFGVESKEGNWKAETAETDLSGTSFVLKNNKGEARPNGVVGQGIVVSSQLLGLHQVGPLSAVAHLARNLGMRTEDIELGLKNTKPFEHRLESRQESGGVIVVDDSYNGNPDGVRAAIDFLEGIKNKRRFYITPGLVEMGPKSEEIHRNIGKQLAEAKIEKVVLIKNSVTHFIEDGLKEKNYSGEIIWFDSALECFRSLPKMTISNDLLLYQNDWPDNYS